MSEERVSIDLDRCQFCGSCIDVCTRSVIAAGEETAYIKNATRCILCDHCMSVCPEAAISVKLLDPEDDFREIPSKENRPDANRLMDLFRSRRSIRFFKTDSVTRADLDTVIKAGRFAPTGGNRQPVKYIVLHTKEMIDRVRSLTHQYLASEADKILEARKRHEKFGEPMPPRAEVRLNYVPLWKAMGKVYEKGRDMLFHHAPAIIMLHSDPERSSPFQADNGLAAMQMVLMAEAMNLGTCFCGFLTLSANNNPNLRELLQIPETNNVVLSFMIGHPNIEYHRMVSRNPAEVNYY